MKRTRVIGLGAMVAAVVVLGACAGDDDDDASADGAGASVTEQAGPPEAASGSDDDAQAPTEESGQNRAGSNLLQEQALIQTAQLTVEVEDVLTSVRQAESMATGSGGRVENEQVSRHDRDGVRNAHLTLRVPGDAYESTLTRLAELGTLVDHVREAKDVTREVVDLESRIATQRESISRVRAILSDASRLADVVTIEGELTRRQADLESLLAQQKALAEQVDLTTIQVTFVAPGEEPEDDNDDPELGFLSGLRNGWEALAAIVVLTLTVLGAVLPFAVVALPIGWLALRATRSARRTPPAPATADGGSKPE